MCCAPFIFFKICYTIIVMLFKNIYALGYSIVIFAVVFIVGEIYRRRGFEVPRESIGLIDVVWHEKSFQNIGFKYSIINSYFSNH